MTTKNVKNLLMMAFIIAASLFTACNKEDEFSSDDVENYVDEVVFDLQSRGNCGKFGCYEFVFPITINFADGTSAEVTDYANMRETLKTYRENNPDGERPTLGYPLEVMTEEGEVITVASGEELAELRRACVREFFQKHRPRGHRFRGMFCFHLQYPVSIAFPEGDTLEVTDRIQLKMALREWKVANPDSEDRPHLVYPLTVVMEDGTEVTVDSKDALKELKESCSE